jgi:small-conductance mechanosensitive channel
MTQEVLKTQIEKERAHEHLALILVLPLPPTLILVHFTTYVVALNRLAARIYHGDSLVCSTHVVKLARRLAQHPGCHRHKTWVDAGDACINLRLLGR